MKIAVVCSDAAHPVMPHLKEWRARQLERGHDVDLVSVMAELTGGDILFLVSCSEILDETCKSAFSYSFVLHASDLPRGRGWSPYIWNILEGNNELTVCLLEATSPVDSGLIWLRRRFNLEGHELLPEIHERIFRTETALMDEVLEKLEEIQPLLQDGHSVSHYPRRTPEDSRLDPNKTLAEQFDLLRVVDYERFPAFFDYRGRRYKLKIEKDDD